MNSVLASQACMARLLKFIDVSSLGVEEEALQRDELNEAEIVTMLQPSEVGIFLMMNLNLPPISPQVIHKCRKLQQIL